jgi:hypothetical protein
MIAFLKACNKSARFFYDADAFMAEYTAIGYFRNIPLQYMQIRSANGCF